MKVNVSIKLDPEIRQWAYDNRVNISQLTETALAAMMQTPAKEKGEEAKIKLKDCMEVLTRTLRQEDQGLRGERSPTAIVFAKTWAYDLRKFGYSFTPEQLLDKARNKLIKNSQD